MKAIRLYVDWDEAPWMDGLSGAAQIAWLHLLCHVRRCGTAGRSRALHSTVAARRWDLAESDIVAMEAAAIAGGVLHRVGREWIVVDWKQYVPPRPRPPGWGDNRWKRLRLAVLERDRWTCRYCGKPADHCDHVLPRSRGGADDPANLVAACGLCNRKKGAQTPQEWKAVSA